MKQKLYSLNTLDDKTVEGYVPKTFATDVCGFCEARHGYWSIKCSVCDRCQYCFAPIVNRHGCWLCGNMLDNRLEVFYGDVIIRRHLKAVAGLSANETDTEPAPAEKPVLEG